MKKLVKLVRIASKESFIKLRKLWEIKCNSIDNNFQVTNLFLRHISWNATKRWITEIIHRLTAISLIEKISKEWILVETRENIKIEKFNYRKSYKIKFTIKNIDFFIILAEKYNWQLVLISVFLNFLE